MGDGTDGEKMAETMNDDPMDAASCIRNMVRDLHTTRTFTWSTTKEGEAYWRDVAVALPWEVDE